MKRKILPFSAKLIMSVSFMILLVGTLLVASAVYLPVRTAYAQADAGTLVLADFETGIPAGFVPFADSWDGSGSTTTLTLDLASVDLPIIPALSPNGVAAVTFDIAASGSWGGGPGYGGITHDFAPAQDWSDYTAISLWYHGSGSGADIRVELKSDGGDAFNSNRYEYTFTDDFTGWVYFNILWGDFTQRTDFNPGPNPADPINLAAMWGYSILLPGGASGTFYLDQVALTAGSVVADFETGIPAGFVPFADSWDGSGSTTTLILDLALVNLPVIPMMSPNSAAAVTFDIAASGSWGGGPGYGGVTHDFTPVQNWSDYQGFSLWYRGSGSGADIRLELKSDGGDAFNSNRYEYTFTDNFTGWVYFNIPWGDFLQRTDFNPGPNPADPINLAAIWGYSILLPGGASGSFYLDQVTVSGVPTETEPEPEPEPPSGFVDIVDDFEAGLPFGTDGDGLEIGFVTWGDFWNGTTVALADPLVGEADPLATPGQVGDNYLLQVDLNVIGWGGLTHAFENEAVDTWVPQDWSSYEGVSFWLYGSNTGNGLFFEINENRNPGSTTNDVEIWTYPFTDDFSGWQQFIIPFDAFTRKEIGNGAPNDGFTREEVHGWAFGSLGSGGPQTYYLDDMSIYGNTGAEIPLTVAFDRTSYEVVEGNPAEIIVELSRPLDEGDPTQISVDYTMEAGTAVTGRDYTPVAGTFTFIQGEPTEQIITVPTFDNLKHDGDKTVILRLSNPVDIDFGFATQTVLAILDDDPLDPTLLDDFERGAYLWEGTNVTLATPEIAADDPMALPGQGDYEHILQVDTAILVDIVIKGVDCKNGNGVIPVALLTTDNFDALTVDHNTVQFGDAFESHRDKQTGEAQRHEKDYDRDGDLDLIFHFRFNETGYVCDSPQLTLMGETFTGQPIVAGGTANFGRDFPIGQDWTRAEGLSFWFYGTNSGDAITFQFKDNRAPGPGPSNWDLVWSDEFDEPAGTPPNSDYWSYEIGDGSVNRIPGWGNSELQYYTDSTENSATDGAGNLVITVKESDEDFICYYGPCEYTSARLISQYKAEFAYGRLESRIHVPQGDGLWPAFWSLGTDIGEVGWPQTGEIDFMEFVGREPYEVFGTIHGPGYSGGASFGNTYTFADPVHDDFHTFAIEWEPDLIKWYVDGILYHTAEPADVAPNEWVFNDPIFIIFNVAVGGNFGGPVGEDTTFPQEMVVDYLRVYQGPDTAERWEATFTDNFEGWQQVTIPFDSLTRSAEQPAGAPNDGLSLNDVWGYSFDLPGGGTSSGVLRLDQMRLVVEPDGSENIIDDFEAGLPATWFHYGDYDAGASVTPSTILVSDRPGGDPETSVLSIDYISAGWGAGTGRDLVPAQDWSAFNGLSFWFYGTNSGTTFELILSDNKSDPDADTAERFHATFTDDFVGWQHINLPWSVFYRGAWQPPGAPDDGLTLTEMWAYAIALPTGTSGIFYMDDVALVE